MITSKKGASCKCGTWKEHWIKFSDALMWQSTCSIEGCNNPAEIGGVMSRFGEKDFIVPICANCNRKTTIMTLKVGTYIANANQSETCNKRKIK